jgi:hypothetical protein
MKEPVPPLGYFLGTLRKGGGAGKSLCALNSHLPSFSFPGATDATIPAAGAKTRPGPGAGAGVGLTWLWAAGGGE